MLFLSTYIPVLLLITSIILFLSFLLGLKINFNREKTSPFECGFDPNKTARSPFSLRFFLITIIFLIFDVEIVLLLPAVSAPSSSSLSWFYVLLTFLSLLLIGLLYEWNHGALNWSI